MTRLTKTALTGILMAGILYGLMAFVTGDAQWPWRDALGWNDPDKVVVYINLIGVWGLVTAFAWWRG